MERRLRIADFEFRISDFGFGISECGFVRRIQCLVFSAYYLVGIPITYGL
jgi:hypothetical protein